MARSDVSLALRPPNRSRVRHHLLLFFFFVCYPIKLPTLDWLVIFASLAGDFGLFYSTLPLGPSTLLMQGIDAITKLLA